MDAESEELLAEFKKLQMEANGLNQRLQTTTSTLGFSTEAMLLRQVLEELKSVKSEVKEIKTEQEKFSKNLGVIHEKVENIEKKQIAHEDKLKSVDESLTGQVNDGIKKVTDALNTEKEDVQAIRTKVESIDEKLVEQATKLETVRESLTVQSDEHHEKLTQTLNTQRDELYMIREMLNDKQHMEKLENILKKVETLQSDVEIVKNVRRKANLIENRQSDDDPILESIIGSWKNISTSNSDEYLEKCSEKERKWFKSTLKVEVTGRRITMSYPEGPSWTHQIGDPHPRTNLLDNHLSFVYEHATEVYRTDDFSIKDGKLVRKEMAFGVEFERIYERI